MPSKPNNVSDVLAEVFKRGGMKRRLKRAEAVLLWPQVAGSELAKFTTAKSLQDGILFIDVPDSETAMHLMLQRQRFLDVYHGKFGVKEVQELRFRVGRRHKPKSKPKAPSAQADPKDMARLARQLGNLHLPDELAQPTMRAARAMLAYRAQRKAEGWSDCPICATLTADGGICVTCKRYAAQVKVKEASRKLAVDPRQQTPLLSDDERLVAIYLAKNYLKERLQELLPQVLADPTFKPHLESAARCYLAHSLNKALNDVNEADLDLLDARVARALGRWK